MFIKFNDYRETRIDIDDLFMYSGTYSIDEEDELDDDLDIDTALILRFKDSIDLTLFYETERQRNLDLMALDKYQIKKDDLIDFEIKPLREANIEQFNNVDKVHS